MGQIIDEYGLEAALIKTKNYIDNESTAIRKGVHPGMTAGKANLANNVEWVNNSAFYSGDAMPSGYYANINSIRPARRSCVWNQLFWKEETYSWGFIAGNRFSIYAAMDIKVPFDFKYGRKYCFEYISLNGATPSVYYYNQDGEKIAVDARKCFPVKLEETQDGFYLQADAIVVGDFYIYDLTLMDGPGYERPNLYDSKYLSSNNRGYNEGTFLSTKVTEITIGADTYPFNITLNNSPYWVETVTPNYTNRYFNIINLSDLTWSPGSGSHVYISSVLPIAPEENYALCNKFPVYPTARVGSLQLSGNYLTYHGTETIDPTEFFKDVQLMYHVARYDQYDVTLPEISFYGWQIISSDAPLSFDVERIACSPLTYNHETIINDLPIIRGDAENSAVLKGGDNQAISKNGVALGNNNIVGLKGFYYKSIQFITNDGCRANIFISEKQVTPTLVSSSPTEGTSINLKNYLSVGDTISIINDVKYENCATITDIFSNNSGFRVQFGDSYPFNEIKPETSLDVEDYSVYCLDKPDAGIVDLGVASFAAGRYNKAINNNATAFGFNNNAYGKFSFVEGSHNKTTNNAEHAEGKYNKSNTGTTIHSIGIGTSETDRKNAHEISTGGKHYIYGLNGYNGTNPTSSNDLVTLLTSSITDSELDSLFND